MSFIEERKCFWILKITFIFTNRFKTSLKKFSLKKNWNIIYKFGLKLNFLSAYFFFWKIERTLWEFLKNLYCNTARSARRNLSCFHQNFHKTVKVIISLLIYSWNFKFHYWTLNIILDTFQIDYKRSLGNNSIWNREEHFRNASHFKTRIFT